LFRHTVRTRGFAQLGLLCIFQEDAQLLRADTNLGLFVEVDTYGAGPEKMASFRIFQKWIGCVYFTTTVQRPGGWMRNWSWMTWKVQ